MNTNGSLVSGDDKKRQKEKKTLKKYFFKAPPDLSPQVRACGRISTGRPCVEKIRSDVLISGNIGGRGVQDRE